MGLIRHHHGAFSTWTRADGLASDSVQDLALDPEGAVWIVAGGQLHRLAGDVVSPLELPPKQASAWIESVAAGEDGAIWLATRADGLLQWRRGQWRAFAEEDGFSARQLLLVRPGRDGSVWVSARPPDPSLCSFRDDRLDSCLATGEGPYELVRALLESRGGAVWLGTTNGLGRLVSGQLRRLEPTPPLRLSRVFALHEDRDRNLWAGSYGDGLHRFTTGVVTTYSASDGLLLDPVMSVLQDRGGRLWVGGQGGLARYDDGRFAQLPGIPPYVRALAEDRDGALWIGTPEHSCVIGMDA